MTLQVSCHFQGGLGNQMFQAAHTLAQSWKHNRSAVFVRWSYTPKQGNTTDKYVNNIFSKLKFIGSNSHFSKVKEIGSSCHFDPVNPVSNDNTIFDGYFQSSKYWLGYEERIKETFAPPVNVIDGFYNKYPQLKEDDTLCLHVRRSDYLKTPGYHPVISKEYIEEGLKVIEKYSTCFVFTDDPEWTKANLNLLNVIFVSEDRDYKELWLMSLCKNYLISNSSFSWWGSYLNPNQDKKIVVPSIWFGPDGPQDYYDIYESNFHKIQVNFKDGNLTPSNKG